MLKARICGWILLLPLFVLSLLAQSELRCVANAVDIRPLFSAVTTEDRKRIEGTINNSVNLATFALSVTD